jgi:hypothetical protein
LRTRRKQNTSDEQVTHSGTLRAFAENASGEHQGANLADTRQAKRGGRSAKRGPGRPHVIDQENPLRPPKLRCNERSSDISLPLMVWQIHLTRRVTNPPKPTDSERHVEGTGHRL